MTEKIKDKKKKKSLVIELKCQLKQCPILAGFKIDTQGETMGSATKVMEARLLDWYKKGERIYRYYGKKL